MDKIVFTYADNDLCELFKVFENSSCFFTNSSIGLTLSNPVFIAFWQNSGELLQRRVIAERSRVKTSKIAVEHELTNKAYEEFYSYIYKALPAHKESITGLVRLLLADICTFLEWAHDTEFLNLPQELKCYALKEIKTMFFSNKYCTLS